MEQKFDEVSKILQIKERMPYFLEKMQDDKRDGFVKYAFSGNLYEQNADWNVAGNVFASKVAYTIGMDDSEPIVKKSLDRIASFVHEDGYIYDDFMCKKQKLKYAIEDARSRQKIGTLLANYKRAESRQCYSALLMYGVRTGCIPQAELRKNGQIDEFLYGFDWRQPWNAGSHLSHMLFFQRLAYENGFLSKEEYKECYGIEMDWIQGIESDDTGSWHKGKVPPQLAINGAMKVITGLNTSLWPELKEEQSRKLIDLCLANVNNEQACDNFNITYVLYYASCYCRGYRSEEIKAFAQNRLGIYLNYYHEEQGGFSFYSERSNTHYYGFPVSKGENVADIHGTALFMWGLSIICKMLEIDEIVGLREIMS